MVMKNRNEKREISNENENNGNVGENVIEK